MWKSSHCFALLEEGYTVLYTCLSQGKARPSGGSRRYWGGAPGATPSKTRQPPQLNINNRKINYPQAYEDDSSDSDSSWPCADSCHALTAEQRYSNSAYKPVAPHRPIEVETPEAEFLDEIQTKVWRDFLLFIQSPLPLWLRFLFHQIHETSYSFCKGEWRKTW